MKIRVLIPSLAESIILNASIFDWEFSAISKALFLASRAFLASLLRPVDIMNLLKAAAPFREILFVYSVGEGNVNYVAGDRIYDPSEIAID